MEYMLILLAALLGLSVLQLIDHKIKGNKSIVRKVFSLLFISILVVGCIFLYGETILKTFNVNMRSFTNVKGFFSSRIIAILALFLLFAFVVLKIIRLFVNYKVDEVREDNKKETAVILLSVCFDIAVIPNIISLNSVIFVVLGIISIVGTGLTIAKLVLSFINKKEVIA